MKTSSTYFNQIDQLDIRLNQWLVTNADLLLRVGSGIAFLESGLFRLFLGTTLLDVVVGHLLVADPVSPDAPSYLIALLECALGLCFFSRRFLQTGIWLLTGLLLLCLVSFVLPGYFLFPNPHSSILSMQYTLIQIILTVVGLFIATNSSQKESAI